MKKILTSLTIILSISVFGQSNVDQAKVKEFLEGEIENKSSLLMNGNSQNIVDSDIIQSQLTFSIDENSGSSILITKYFIGSDSKYSAYDEISEVLASNVFIEGMKSSGFKLKSEEDGVAFQTMLKQLDRERGLGFFTEGTNWYFVRDKFFDDVEVYSVSTNDEGEINSIIYESEFEKPLPETLQKEGENLQLNDAGEKVISKKDSTFFRNYLFNQVNYDFEISPLNFYSINKISTISLNKVNLNVTLGEEGMSYTNRTPFLLISNNNEYKKTSMNDLFEAPLFLKSLHKYKIKSEDDARLFQYVLDDISPVNKSDIELKTFYQRDNMWIFVREKRFDDLLGYILVTDKKNKVVYLENTTISEESILRMKMKDPDFEVDYKFELVQPTSNQVTLKRGEGLRVEISFDADMVNATGCWILTRRDGRDARMRASTSMESPFTHAITGMSLENSNHTFEYFLLKNGSEDTENALGVIKVEIKVE